ncbi:hypothetical protein MANES_02G012001v8 [Manihot esculenta]|uniref:Uncharacterized protein n=1 Tax=Manihot esculenta TaxID=3983 RepID=A0A2C9WA54_MANES|nr:hypothetical protein MANES_02G012001v8 [Manihot esculenta]
MENLQDSTHQQNPITHNPPSVWDCGSTLYDSFELKSFERQLYSAIHSRTLSLPHLTDRRVSAPVEYSLPSKISRSLLKFLKSMFKSKQNSSDIFGINSLVRRSGSERFTVTSMMGISCA